MKNINLVKVFVLVMAACTILSSCKSKQPRPAYDGTQTRPTTAAQRTAATRGVRLQMEECEMLAMDETANLRESGNAISDRESFAANLALLDARARLAQQLEVLVNGMIRSFNQQYESNQQMSSVAKAGQIQQAYFEQFLTNTRSICRNLYAREDGRYNAYVCIEMNAEQMGTMYRKLREDQYIGIDFQEHQFLKELEKAKEEYRQQRLD